MMMKVEDVQLFKRKLDGRVRPLPDDTNYSTAVTSINASCSTFPTRAKLSELRDSKCQPAYLEEWRKIRHFEFSNDSKILYILNTALEQKAIPRQNCIQLISKRFWIHRIRNITIKLRIREIDKPENYVREKFKIEMLKIKF